MHHMEVYASSFSMTVPKSRGSMYHMEGGLCIIEMKALVGRNGYLMRRLVGEVVRSADDKRLTESQLLKMLGLESIQLLIRKRKLQWVVYCARRGEKDLTWKRMVREVKDGRSKWGSRLKEEWKTLGVNTVRGWCNKVKDRGWLASKLGGIKKKRKEKTTEKE